MPASLRSSLTSLTKLRCAIFETAHNPTGVRTGAKFLRKRLRGPSMNMYYPPEISISAIARKYPQLELVDEDEVYRFETIEEKKQRGKGAPKKTKDKKDSRRTAKKR